LAGLELIQILGSKISQIQSAGQLCY